MIINQQSLSMLYTGLTAVFNAAFQETPDPWYQRLAMTISANTRIMDYKFMLNFPAIREWIGDRQISSLEAEAYQVETKDWESTIEVDRNDLEDDTLGLYKPILSALAQEARQHPNALIAALLAGGFTQNCYDGSTMFAADHPMPTPADPTAQVSNTGGGAGTAWFLLDTSRAIKPFIFQMRRDVQLTSMINMQDEQVFMRKKYRYGVDYRAAAAYGLWQLAYGSKQDLTPENYAAGRAAMMSIKNGEGRPLGIKPNLLVVPPALESTGRELLNSQFIIGAPGVGGSKNNVWQGTAELLLVPELG